MKLITQVTPSYNLSYFSFKCGNNYDIFYASGSFGCEYGTTMIYYVLLIPIKLGF